MPVSKSVPVKTTVPIEIKSEETKEAVRMPKLPQLIIGACLIVVFGALSGYAAAKMTTGAGTEQGQSGKSVAKTVGVADVKGKDSAEGILVEGGINSEGTHHLERPGGDSQSVYLTSSVIPLDEYVGKKIRVWGETFDGQSAGWLMDVVKLEVLE